MRSTYRNIRGYHRQPHKLQSTDVMNMLTWYSTVLHNDKL